jgi:hypothetical protein
LASDFVAGTTQRVFEENVLVVGESFEDDRHIAEALEE